MPRSHWVRALSVAAALAVSAALVARAQEPQPKPTLTEKIKAKAGSAVESIKKGAASAEEAVRDQYLRAKSAVTKMGIEARVYARIHWEKGLATSKVDLASPTEGVIALNGTVVDDRARAKAVELTRDTIGVTQVIDNLTVQTVTSTGTTVKPEKN
jgi:hyperosmotically inducible protein